MKSTYKEFITGKAQTRRTAPGSAALEILLLIAAITSVLAAASLSL